MNLKEEIYADLAKFKIYSDRRMDASVADVEDKMNLLQSNNRETSTKLNLLWAKMERLEKADFSAKIAKLHSDLAEEMRKLREELLVVREYSGMGGSSNPAPTSCLAFHEDMEKVLSDIPPVAIESSPEKAPVILTHSVEDGKGQGEFSETDIGKVAGRMTVNEVAAFVEHLVRSAENGVPLWDIPTDTPPEVVFDTDGSTMLRFSDGSSIPVPESGMTPEEVKNLIAGHATDTALTN